MRLRRIALLLLALIVAALLSVGVVRDAGHKVGLCARDAMALSRMSQVVRAMLYDSSEHFLAGGGPLAELRPEAARMLNQIDENARESAQRLPSLLFRGSADNAREMLLAAEQERNLAVEPRGTWISYVSETSKARSDFDKASDRYRLSRSSWITGDEETNVKAEITRQTKAFFDEVKLVSARLERKVAAMNAEFRGVPSPPAPTEIPTPDRLANTEDFQWKWEDSGNAITAGGKTLRHFRLRFRNTTGWPIYNVSVAFTGGKDLGLSGLGTAQPALWYSEWVWWDQPGDPPSPTLTGRFSP